MSQLLTQCPFCQTTFKVSDAQMQAASGVVRCGACMEVFLASQHRVILKERPAPVIVEEDEIGDEIFEEEVFDDAAGDIEDTAYEDDALLNEDATDNLLDDEEEDDDDLQRDVTAENVTIAEAASDDTDTFTSWEEEEDYSRTETLAWFPGAEEVDDDHEAAWEAEDETQATPAGEALSEDHDEEPEQEHEEAQPANGEDRPAYSGQLNPAGYSMTQFTVESLLSGISGLFATGSSSAKEAEEASGPLPDEEAGAEELAQPDHDSEQLPKVPAPARTAIIVPDRSARIPTLEPDVVAREDVPAATAGPQNLTWFQSLRKSLRDSRTRKTGDTDSDEKAEIRRRLEGLRADDSLDPVDSAHFDTLAAEPVELQGRGPQWSRLQHNALITASAVLLLTLAGQYFWFNLDSLVLSRRMPAVTGYLCQLRTCPDRNAIDLSTLVTEELVVRSHPERQDALQVDFIFRNDNNREQRFPLVELNFTNIDGDVIANRIFSSMEYLPPEMQLFTHMPAHSSIQVSLELVDPGAEATSYFLIFRNP